jgi:hypothetical protein
MAAIWPNHRSHPIPATSYYRWVLWLEGDDSDLDQVSSVRYILHPTFEREYAESSNRSDNFRIDARGWGSFYVDVRIRFNAGFEERISYFLDVRQFFRRREAERPKRYEASEISIEELSSAYEDGFRDFSNIRIFPSNSDDLIGVSLAGADFHESDFTDVSLIGANLARTNLSRTRFVNSDLSGSNLTFARLTEADMSGAILHAVNRTNWIIDGVFASHAFLDRARKRRIPSDCFFASSEFEKWLKDIPTMENVLPPETRTVFNYI